jgi:preprotein translocase subunit SecE
MAEGNPSNKPPRQKPAASKALPATAKPSRAVAKQAKDKEEKSGGPTQWWETAVQFLREVKTELKKVTWPARQQAVSSTGVVLALVIVVSLFLGLVDMVLTHVVRALIG